MLLSFFPRREGQVIPSEDDQHDEHPSMSSRDTNDDIEIHGDQLVHMANKHSKLQWWDLWALGVSTAIGGHFFIWNLGLIVGFGHYIIAFFIVASGYGMLALCMAELSGALPFAGGAYGIARVTLGTLPGFLIGCFDAYQSMFNTLYCTIALGMVITFAADIDRKWEPLWWFLTYVSFMIVHIVGGPWMWRTLKLLSFASLILLVIYILGSAKFGDFEENAPLFLPLNLQGDERWFQGGIRLFLKAYPLPSWFFMGCESINLACHDCENPKRDVPRAYLLTFATVFCTSIATMFAAASVYPGTTGLSLFLFPTAFSYMRIFDIDLQRATALSLPALYTSAFGFTYYYGSQIRAMGKSGLANPWLGYDVPGLETPVPALLFGMVIGILVGLRYFYLETLPHEDLLSINLLGATATYCSQFFSFIVFRLYYPTIKREFSSPLGIAGSIYGLLVFLLMFIIISGFEKKPAIAIFAGYLIILLLYYFLVVQRRQTFSEEEKTVLFKAYLIKSNRSRHNRVRTGQARAGYALATHVGDTPIAQIPRTKPAAATTTTSTDATASTIFAAGSGTPEHLPLRSFSDDPTTAALQSSSKDGSQPPTDGASTLRLHGHVGGSSSGTGMRDGEDGEALQDAMGHIELLSVRRVPAIAEEPSTTSTSEGHSREHTALPSAIPLAAEISLPETNGAEEMTRAQTGLR